MEIGRGGRYARFAPQEATAASLSAPPTPRKRRTSAARLPVASRAANEFQATGDQSDGLAVAAEVALMTATACRLYPARDGSPKGGAAGSIGRPRRERGRAKLRT